MGLDMALVLLAMVVVRVHFEDGSTAGFQRNERHRPPRSNRITLETIAFGLAISASRESRNSMHFGHLNDPAPDTKEKSWLKSIAGFFVDRDARPNGCCANE